MGSGAAGALFHLKVEEVHVEGGDLLRRRASRPAGVGLNTKLVIVLAVLRAETSPLLLLVRLLSLRAASEVVPNGRGRGVGVEVVRRVREALPDLVGCDGSFSTVAITGGDYGWTHGRARESTGERVAPDAKPKPTDAEKLRMSSSLPQPDTPLISRSRLASPDTWYSKRKRPSDGLACDHTVE